MGYSATIRQYTSISHIQAAAIMARQTSAAERDWGGTGGPKFDELGWNQIVANATGTVFLGVAFVEADVNELLEDCSEGSIEGASRKGLGSTVRNAIGALLPHHQRDPVYGKWRHILRAAGVQPPVDAEREWRFLVRLRNDLVHARPEDVTVASTIPEIPVTVHSLETECRARFAPNPKVIGDGGFLGKWLGGPCAWWAIATALAYADSCWTQLGQIPPYEHIRGRLTQESPTT